MFNKLIKIKNNRGFIKYLKNTIWMFTDHSLRLISGLFIGVWVARFLGPDQYGIFSYAIAFTTLFSSLSRLGLDYILAKELIKTPEKSDILLGTAFWLRISSALLTFLLLIIGILVSKNDKLTNIYILIIGTGMFFQCFDIIEIYFQSQVLGKYISITKINQLLLSILVKLILVLNNSELIWFVAVTLFDHLTLQIGYLVAYRLSKAPLFYNKFNFKCAIQILKNCWPILISSMMVAVYMRIDQLLLKEMLGVRSVGIYSAALKVSEIWYAIPVILSNSLFPALISVKITKEVYYERLQKSFNLMVVIASGIALPMTIVSNKLMLLLFGKGYEGSGLVLSIHIWTGVFFYLGWISERWIVNENLQHLSLIRAFLGAAVNILFNLILINKIGIIGAAISTLIAQFISVYLFNLISNKTRILFKLQSRSLFIYGFYLQRLVIRCINLYHQKYRSQ